MVGLCFYFTSRVSVHDIASQTGMSFEGLIPTKVFDLNESDSCCVGTKNKISGMRIHHYDLNSVLYPFSVFFLNSVLQCSNTVLYPFFCSTVLLLFFSNPTRANVFLRLTVIAANMFV